MAKFEAVAFVCHSDNAHEGGDVVADVEGHSLYSVLAQIGRDLKEDTFSDEEITRVEIHVERGPTPANTGYGDESVARFIGPLELSDQLVAEWRKQARK